MEDILSIISRNRVLFDVDVFKASSELASVVRNSSFLVIGGAGSIGQALQKIFKRKPEKLHVVDINENNLVELVRDTGAL